MGELGDDLWVAILLCGDEAAEALLLRVLLLVLPWLLRRLVRVVERGVFGDLSVVLLRG